MALTQGKRLNVVLSDELHRRFKIYCIQHGLDMTAVLTKLIEKAVSPHRKRGAK